MKNKKYMGISKNSAIILSLLDSNRGEGIKTQVFRVVHLLFIFLLTQGIILCQDTHFSNITSALTYSNPSYIAVSEDAKLSTTYRNQWPGLNYAFQTYCASFILPAAGMKSAFGLNLIHDSQARGAIMKTSLQGVYAYTVKVSSVLDVAAGLGLSYNFRGINESRFVFESDITGDGSTTIPLNYADYRSDYGDFSLGLTAIFNERFYSGISVNHITKPAEHAGNLDFVALSRRYTLHFGGIISLSHNRGKDEVFLLPGIMFQQQNHYQEILYGVNCQINPFKFGLWARQDMGFNFDALILFSGFSWQLYHFYYSYDVNLKKINFFSTGMGAHEVTFSVNFQYKDKRKKRGAIKCPRI